jgi:hypothetical protein
MNQENDFVESARVPKLQAPPVVLKGERMLLDGGGFAAEVPVGFDAGVRNHLNPVIGRRQIAFS